MELRRTKPEIKEWRSGLSVGFERWEEFPSTELAGHPGACCTNAHAWLLAMDKAQLGGDSTLTGPRWLCERYQWGPNRHPLHWCEAVRAKVLDCGALAALARACFRARGITTYPLQLMQRYDVSSIAHWRKSWEAASADVQWLADEGLIYHEGCAVNFPDGRLRFWDSSAGTWLETKIDDAYGGVVAWRIRGPQSMHD